MKVLIVEDEKGLAQSIKEALTDSGHDAEIALDGEDAFFKIHTHQYQLILLDWMLPNRSGPEILRTVRQLGNNTHTIMITARGELEDKIEGLDSGADDYLVKPFAIPELLARIRSLSRRFEGNSQTSRYQIEDLSIDLVTRRVDRGNQSINLTPKEFEILSYLASQQGRPVSREQLTKDVWKINARATPMDSVIDVSIARLRKKIDERYERKLIRTIRGIGFELGSEQSNR